MNGRSEDELIEKVRKILARTERAGCTAAESEAAFATASRIMAGHNIGMEGVGVVAEVGEQYTQEAVISCRRWSHEYDYAAIICRDFFFIQMFRDGFGKGATPKTMFFGTPTNIEGARFVFHSLLDAYGRRFREYRSGSGCPATDRKVFVVGVTQGFRDKLIAERRAMDAESRALGAKGTGLAIRSAEDKSNRAFREANAGLRAGAKAPRLFGNQSSLDAGYAAGRSLNLNRGVAADGRKAIGG